MYGEADKILTGIEVICIMQVYQDK